MDLRGHSGGSDSEQLTIEAKHESGYEPELTPRTTSGPQRKALGALSSAKSPHSIDVKKDLPYLRSFRFSATQ